MVYTPQRRHAVASVLSVLQHFYTPNILILVSRLLGQAQATAAPYVHPTRSLFILFFMITAIHAASVLLHFLDFWSEMNGTKGIILDFIGQASLLRILLLDCGIYLLQVISLVISYITNHSSNLPKSSFFPDGDLLLPPLQSASSITTDNDEDVASSGVRRRKGKGKASVEDEESSLWLDEDEDVDRSQPLSSTTALLGTGSERYHRREPPIIASLPLPYLINLICRLPAPVGPPPLTSGGTPLASPAPTPVAEVPPLLNIPRPPRSPRSPRPDRSGELPHSPRHSGLTSEWEAEEEGDIETGGRNVRRGAAGSMPDTPGRIPGDYWASIPTTDR